MFPPSDCSRLHWPIKNEFSMFMAIWAHWICSILKFWTDFCSILLILLWPSSYGSMVLLVMVVVEIQMQEPSNLMITIDREADSISFEWVPFPVEVNSPIVFSWRWGFWFSVCVMVRWFWEGLLFWLLGRYRDLGDQACVIIEPGNLIVVCDRVVRIQFLGCLGWLG